MLENLSGTLGPEDSKVVGVIFDLLPVGLAPLAGILVIMMAESDLERARNGQVWY